MPELTGAVMAGSGSIRSTDDWNGRDLQLLVSGSGDIDLSGRVESAEIRTTGSGSFRGARFQVGVVDITITGSGDIELERGSEIGQIRTSGSGNFS
jgi:hypothetical protein